MSFANSKTMIQLKECIIKVSKRKSKSEIFEMFTTELEIAADCLINWFIKKVKSKNLELDIR